MAKQKPDSFEAVMQQLEEILEKISDESTPLEESIQLYAKAAEHIAQCDATLKDAQQRVDAIGASLEELGDTDDF